MTIFLILLLPFAGTFLPLVGRNWHRTACAWATALPVFVSLALLLSLMPAVFAGETFHFSVDWLPALGLNFSLMLDGLGFLFSLLILGIGLLVILYARYYLSAQDPMGKFYCLLLLFMGAMLGVVLSSNVLLLVVFWELTSLSSFLLIGYWRHRADARQGARMALTITGAGGLAMLAGMLLLGHIVGSFELTEILPAAERIQAHPLYVPMLVLVLLGALTKSAQFPFHFWLPHAMAAPTPVSAYLHSATMVKAGVFLLARMFPALAGTEEWSLIVGCAGAATFVFAAYVAFFKHDLKGLLAYSTLSHLGLITLLFGLGTPLGAVAGVFHIINHATFKASLFMAAGIVDHEAGTRDIRRLGGLRKYMPYTAVLAMVAAAAMAGVPLLNGFLSKEMFFAEVLTVAPFGEGWMWVLPVAAVFGGIFSVAYSLRFIHDVFFGKESPDMPKKPHEPPRYMKVPVEILVALCLIVGVIPSIVVGGLLATAAGAVLLGQLPYYSLAVWHGFNVPLLMSAVALGTGIFIYTQRRHLFRLHDKVFPRLEGKAVFDALLTALLALAQGITRRMDNGSLQRYLLLIVLTTVVLGALPLLAAGWPVGTLALTPVSPVAVIVWALLIATSLGVVVLHRRRLAALVIVGVVGLIVSIAFAYFSAPDLALTQLSVELVTTILLLLALNLLPKESPIDSSTLRRLRDGGIAVLSGVGVAALVYAVLTRPFAFDPTSGSHLLLSKPGGGGTNVVNVILVDFRGWDTFGEITVLGIAALGIYAMLFNLRPPMASMATGGGLQEARHPLIMALVSRVLLPLALLVSLYIFLRGHNLPGGGFIAGLLASIALVMQYMASGTAWAGDRLWQDYRFFIGLGLLIAGLTGVGSWLFERPFLTSAFGYLYWPVVGKFEVASAMAFDTGVFLTVIGAVTLMLVNLGALRAAQPAPHKEST
jgi:multicomponent K+:H+ antiporter subunit A